MGAARGGGRLSVKALRPVEGARAPLRAEAAELLGGGAELCGSVAAGAGGKTGLKGGPAGRSFRPMPMSVEQLVSESRHLPREQAAELLERLLLDASNTPDGEIDAAWKQEISGRVAEIESGREAGVDGEQVMAELRRIVGR